MLYWAQSAQAAQQATWSGGGSCRPGWRSGLFGTALALLNFGIDEYVNPRLRAAGITGRRARRAGLPRRPHLGLTPVLPGRRHHDPGERAAGPQKRPGDERDPITVSGLCVDYGLGEGAVHAVVDADFTLRPGEVLGLAGESGSGKSTLAYAVTRLLRAPGIITAGQARLRPVGQTCSPRGPRASCAGCAGTRSPWSCRAR